MRVIVGSYSLQTFLHIFFVIIQWKARYKPKLSSIKCALLYRGIQRIWTYSSNFTVVVVLTVQIVSIYTYTICVLLCEHNKIMSISLFFAKLHTQFANFVLWCVHIRLLLSALLCSRRGFVLRTSYRIDGIWEMKMYSTNAFYIDSRCSIPAQKCLHI